MQMLNKQLQVALAQKHKQNHMQASVRSPSHQNQESKKKKTFCLLFFKSLLPADYPLSGRFYKETIWFSFLGKVSREKKKDKSTFPSKLLVNREVDTK